MSDNETTSKFVGIGTPASRLKGRFRRANVNVSLKQYARKLRTDGDVDAKEWFQTKGGAYEQIAKTEREERKGKMIREQKAAKRAKSNKDNSKKGK